MAKESLDRILEAEAQGRELVRKAKEDSKKKVQAALENGEIRLSEGIKVATEEQNIKDEVMKKELEPEIEHILDTAREKGDKLIKNSEAYLPQAVKFLKERVFN